MTETPVPPVAPILVAIDFSPASEAALAWAAAEARTHDAPLIVLHVVHEPEDDPGWYRRLEGGDEDEGEDDSPVPMDVAARRVFEAFLDRCRASMRDLRALGDVEERVVTGIPTTRILEVAADRGVSHLVLGTRGRTGLKHLLGGSTAGRVAQLAPMPVTIVKARRDAPDDADAVDPEPGGDAPS